MTVILFQFLPVTQCHSSCDHHIADFRPVNKCESYLASFVLTGHVLINEPSGI